MSSQCTCSSEGYSPDCPQAFMQGGVLLHTLTAETHLKPRKYTETAPLTPEPLKLRGDAITGESFHDNENSSIGSEPETIHGVYDNFFARESRKHGYAFNSAPNYLPADQKENYRERADHTPAGNPKTIGSRMIDGFQMLAAERSASRKFEAISMGGKDLTEIMIDGFQVDLNRVAQKAKEIAPLPPAKLPIIFQDHELNFYHHFFGGMDMLVGKLYLEDIISANTYHANLKADIALSLRDIIEVGYEEEDNETTVFTKVVLRSTFELASKIRQTDDCPVFVVAANLWGFQYLENGMKLKEADLRMWLSICKSHYRTAWFNTFKASGVPSFAIQGVHLSRPADVGQKVIPGKQIAEVHVVERQAPAATPEDNRALVHRSHKDRHPDSFSRRRKH